MITVPNDIPCADLLNQIITGLDDLQKQIDRLDEQLESLKVEGVYLSGEDPVVPSLSEKKNEGRVVGHYLVWPTWYARRSGASRRKYVRKNQIKETKNTIIRTRQYERLLKEREGLLSKIGQVESDLRQIVRWRFGHW